MPEGNHLIVQIAPERYVMLAHLQQHSLRVREGQRVEFQAEDSTLYELVSRLIPERKLVPQRANVANRTREDLERLVRERNPEWWEREQVRQAEAQRLAAARADSARRGNAAPNPPQTCVPSTPAR